MSTAAVRKPLVYSTRVAQEQATRVVPGRIIENEVERAIMRGDVVHGVRGGVVFGESESWVAHVERIPPRVRERGRAWLIVRVEKHHDSERRYRNGNVK